MDKLSIVDGALAYVYPNEGMRHVRVEPSLFVEASSLLFTHDVPSLFLERPCFDRIAVRFYVCRDPRPVYISLCHHSVRPAILRLLPSMRIKTLEEVMQRDDLTVSWAERWRDHVRSYLERSEAFELVRFESLVSEKRGTLRRIVETVDPESPVACRERLVDRVERVTDFHAMQKDSPGHVRKGGVDDWITEISLPARKIIEDVAGNEMRALGYRDPAT